VNLSDLIIDRECIARRKGRREVIPLALILGCIVGVGLMLGMHVALAMRSDAIHAVVQQSIKQADAILGGDRGLLADVTECRDLVELVSEDKYQNVRDYHRQIDALQGRVK
jgi:hypothetical protein